jgi:transposase
MSIAAAESRLNGYITWGFYGIFRQCLSKAFWTEVNRARGYYFNGDDVVEIDESMFCKKQKYHRGHHHEGIWVFGMVERESRKCLLIPVPDRKRATLLPLIQRFIKPGSYIYSDCWSAYLTLGDHGYRHQLVNHSQHFAQGATHTNTIEGLWAHAKAGMKNSKGIKRNDLKLYLDEFMMKWVHMHGPEDRFQIISKAVAHFWNK